MNLYGESHLKHTVLLIIALAKISQLSVSPVGRSLSVPRLLLDASSLLVKESVGAKIKKIRGLHRVPIAIIKCTFDNVSSILFCGVVMV